MSSRLGNLLQASFRHMQRLFHLLVGFAFLFLAFAGASVSFLEWRCYRATPSVGLLRFGLLAGFTVLLVIFCLYSLAKARSVR
jgi:membrane protein implicated in regulation of membrane protease activity